MPKKKSEQSIITHSGMQDLLAEQSSIILGAVDQRFAKVDKRLDGLEQSINSRLATTEVRILSDIDRKLVLMEERINRKFDKLTTTLDKFLNISQLKKIIQEKLGVNLA